MAKWAPHPNLPPTEEGTTAQPLLNGDTLQSQDELSGEFYWEADPLTYKSLKNFVLQNRSQPTRAEDLLWQQLKAGKLENYKFRRQHVIGNFIVDFVCLAKKLVIEVDGLMHQLPENKISDEERTMWLGIKGYTVIRFTNEEILFDLENALNRIKQQLKELPFASKKTYELSKKRKLQCSGGCFVKRG